MEYCIRHATEEDVEALNAVYADGDRVHHDALPQVFRPARYPARPYEVLARLLAHDDVAVLVAEADRQIVALVEVHLRVTPALPMLVPRQYVEVESLIVRRAWRRAGIGRALMRAAERWAHEKGATETRLNVWEFNAGAIRFYEQLGYHMFSRRMSKSLETPRANETDGPERCP
jgi:ribosomal protein S18 acetylase RimI-like enzyme